MRIFFRSHFYLKKGCDLNFLFVIFFFSWCLTLVVSDGSFCVYFGTLDRVWVSGWFFFLLPAAQAGLCLSSGDKRCLVT